MTGEKVFRLNGQTLGKTNLREAAKTPWQRHVAEGTIIETKVTVDQKCGLFFAGCGCVSDFIIIIFWNSVILVYSTEKEASVQNTWDCISGQLDG